MQCFIVLLCTSHLPFVTLPVSLWVQHIIVLMCTLHLHFLTVAAACLPMSSVPHGDIDYSAARQSRWYPGGTIATLSCESHYIPIGPSQVTCQNNDEWEDTFECRGDNIVILFWVVIFSYTFLIIFELTLTLYLFVASCPPLSLSHGYVGYATDPEDGRYYLDTVATHDCNSGYSREGGRFRTCQSSGNWNGQAPTCNEGKEMF